MKKLLLLLPLLCGLAHGQIVNPRSTVTLWAMCTGTVGTGNGTEYILFPFQGTNSGCTVTTGTEMPMPLACTASQLVVKASAAGALAGSGVVKVYKNGSATSNMTCTLGTGTSCTDTSTTMAYAAGDTYKVTVTTGQATDTTANLRINFICQ